MMMKYRHSLIGRLTLWYAGSFALCFLAVIATFYSMMLHRLHNWADAELREEVLEISTAYNSKGLDGILEQFRIEESSEGKHFLGRIMNSEDVVTFETAPDFWAKVPVNESLVARARSGDEEIEMLDIGNNQTVRVVYSLMPDGSVAQIGLSIFEYETWLKESTLNLGKVALLSLFLSIGAGAFMAKRALVPIREIARTATAISGRSLGQRVPVIGHGDEIDQLAEAFNGMLGRIDTLVEGMRDVTDTLAHDLRTPMTAIRGTAEVTLRSHRDSETYRMALYQNIEQMDCLLTMFNSILDAAEAESGTLVLRHEALEMDELTNEIEQVFKPAALDKGIDFQAHTRQGLRMRGDRGRLIQALANLMDNAIKYTPSGGEIRLSVEPDSHHEGIVASVTDTGIGITEKDLPHIFERYYRGDKSRSGSGIGLGLPLVAGIVKAHGGTVTAENNPGGGSTFSLFLPCEGHPFGGSDGG